MSGTTLKSGVRARHGVLLAAHGDGDASNANTRLRALAERLTGEKCCGVPVALAFNIGSPGFADALDTIHAEKITVIPIMTSQGYFTRERLPAALDASSRVRDRAAGQEHDGTVEITPPVGAVRSLIAAMRARAIEEIERLAAGGEPVAVVVIGHGTRRNASSAASTRELADELVDHLARGRVVTAFLDQEPLLEDVAAQIPERSAVFVPFMIGGGNHVEHDIRERVSRGRNQRGGVRDVVLPALGDEPFEPALADAVRSLIRWHAPDRVFRVGTRSSPLALRQTQLVVDALVGEGLARESVELVHVGTVGDRDQRTPLDELARASGTDGVFTDELEDALRHGEIDLAVHSLKDLPLEYDARRRGRDTVIAAVLPRASAHEVLVTRDGRGLAELPRGARVGTSSARRTAQLLALRPDLHIVPLRGGVDRRLEQVAEGRMDAAILAEAGLERLGERERIAERFALERLVPEAGQGAIAVTVRGDDRPARQLVKPLDHAATRLAVETERAVARRIQARSDGESTWIAAAHAGVQPDGWVHLIVCAIDTAGEEIRITRVERETPAEAIAGALRAIFPQGGAR